MLPLLLWLLSLSVALFLLRFVPVAVAVDDVVVIAAAAAAAAVLLLSFLIFTLSLLWLFSLVFRLSSSLHPWSWSRSQSWWSCSWQR